MLPPHHLHPKAMQGLSTTFAVPCTVAETIRAIATVIHGFDDSIIASNARRRDLSAAVGAADEARLETDGEAENNGDHNRNHHFGRKI